MMVPTTALGGTFGAAGLAFGIAATVADFVALVDAGAVAALRLAGNFAASGAGGATAGAFLVLGVFATAGGVHFASTGAAVADFAAFAKTRLAGAGAAGGAAEATAGLTDTAAALFTATTATSPVFWAVLRGAGFFAGNGAAAACFSGAGLRALLDGAFALAAGAFGEEAGVVKALEAVDFAVFFVVNL